MNRIRVAIVSLLFSSACAAEVERVTQGPVGERGEAGARGPRGLPGADAAPLEREEVQAHSEPLAAGDKGTMIRAVARCSEGARVVTGGCLWYADGPDAIGSVAPYASRPVVEGDRGEDDADAEGWICDAKDLTGEGRIHAWAVCEVLP